MKSSEYPEGRAGRKKMVAKYGLPDGIEHGASAYNNWGCRDPICTEAQAQREREARDARYLATEENDGIAPVAVHNQNTKRNWGCKCSVCLADYNAKRPSRAKHAA